MFYYLWDWFPCGSSPTSVEVSGKTAIDLIEDGSESMGMLHVTVGECSFFLPSPMLYKWNSPSVKQGRPVIPCHVFPWFSLWARLNIGVFDSAPFYPVYNSFFADWYRNSVTLSAFYCHFCTSFWSFFPLICKFVIFLYASCSFFWHKWICMILCQDSRSELHFPFYQQ